MIKISLHVRRSASMVHLCVAWWWCGCLILYSKGASASVMTLSKILCTSGGRVRVKVRLGLASVMTLRFYVPPEVFISSSYIIQIHPQQQSERSLSLSWHDRLSLDHLYLRQPQLFSGRQRHTDVPAVNLKRRAIIAMHDHPFNLLGSNVGCGVRQRCCQEGPHVPTICEDGAMLDQIMARHCFL